MFRFAFDLGAGQGWRARAGLGWGVEGFRV